MKEVLQKKTLFVVIPLLIALLSVELSVSYSGIHHGLKDRLFRKKRGEPQ